MPYFTRKIESNGLLLKVQVGVSEERKRYLQDNQSEVPQEIVVHGIIDTGASSTCIDPSVVKELKLESKGDIEMLTPSTGDTPVMLDQYDVSLAIFAAPQDPPFYVDNLPVVESQSLLPQGFQVLIGRDILSQCLLTYDGFQGQYSLAF